MSTLDTNVLILRLPVCDKICPQAKHNEITLDVET